MREGDRERGDQAQTAAEAVHAVDQVECVDDQQDPENCHGVGEYPQLELDAEAAPGVNPQAQAHQDRGGHHLSGELVAGSQASPVVDDPQAEDQQCGERQAPRETSPRRRLTPASPRRRRAG